MESAHRNYILGNYEEALDEYTKLRETDSSVLDYSLHRAICNIALGKYDNALEDLEQCESLNPKHFEVELHKGIAEFYSKIFPNALISFQKAKDACEFPYQSRKLEIWLRKSSFEVNNPSPALKNEGFAPKIEEAPSKAKVEKKEEVKMEVENAEEKKLEEGENAVEKEESEEEKAEKAEKNKLEEEAMAAALAEAEKRSKMKRPEFDWYQNITHVILEIKMKNQTEETCKIALEERFLTIDSVNKETQNEEQFTFDLTQKIVPEQSVKTITNRKIHLRLKKEDDSITWATLERADFSRGDIHNYPSSFSKGSKNWDKIGKKIEKDALKEKPEGDEALNKLFKDIYGYKFQLLLE
jgi:suppressor of G2 allele of SKP1